MTEMAGKTSILRSYTHGHTQTKTNKQAWEGSDWHVPGIAVATHKTSDK